MRIFYSILILLLIIGTPFWFYLPVIFVGIVMFPFFVEAIIFGLLIDFVYGLPSGGMFLGSTYGVAGAILVYLAIPLREHLRFNV